MRPVDRGGDPSEGWTDWGPQAANALAAAMGWYCAYCEIYLGTGPQVEHVRPKKLNEELATTWSNWLLACVNCNTIKGTDNESLGTRVWPDRDNTARAFVYGEGGAITVSASLDQGLQDLARSMYDLVGLDRRPGHAMWSPADRRWERRGEAFRKAMRARDAVQNHPESDLVLNIVVDGATSTGFWSVWMAVFADNVRVSLRLLTAFLTAGDCFDDSAKPVPRPGGVC